MVWLSIVGFRHNRKVSWLPAWKLLKTMIFLNTGISCINIIVEE